MQHSAAAALFISALFLLPQTVLAQKTPKQTGKALQKILKQESRKAKQAKEVLLPVRQWERTPQPAATSSELILPVRQWERPQQQTQLSLMERAELTSRLELVENLRRALQKDPAIIVKPKFAKQMETLNKLGIAMPQIDALPETASEKAKQTFVANLQNQIETALNKAQADISAKLGYPPAQEFSLHQVIENSRKELLLARGRHEQKWEVLENAAAKKNPVLSWGTPGLDLIEIAPLQLAKTKALVAQMQQENPGSLGAMLDIVLYSNLNQSQKAEFMQHIAGMSELVGYNFVQAYLKNFKQLPNAKNIRAAEYTDYRLLNKYARNTQADLLEKQWASKSAMAPQDAAAFTTLASFVDYPSSRASMMAIAHGEHKAALWLLRHAPSNVISHKIVQYLYTQYPPKEYNVLFSNVEKPEVVPVPDIPLYDKAAYQKSLEARLEVLGQRIESTGQEITRLTNRVNNLSAHIESAKNTFGAELDANNTQMQLVYFRSERAKADLRVTQLKDLVKKLRIEFKEVYGDLQDLLR